MVKVGVLRREIRSLANESLAQDDSDFGMAAVQERR
jgi:hypothetical protein